MEDISKETTSIALKNCYGEYTIICKDTDMCLTDLVQNLVIPVLYAAGYQKENIVDIFNLDL